jgi:hypothetical protein
MKKLITTILALIVAQFSGQALAQSSLAKLAGEDNVLRLQMSPYTYHFSEDPNHRNVVMLGVERQHPNNKLDGVVLFSNSFGQPSIYVYPWGGVYKSIWGVQPLSFKWTAGLIYGYRGEFKDEVANVGGLAPAVIVGLAYEFKPGWSAQVNLLGGAAMQFQLNVPLE